MDNLKQLKNEEIVDLIKSGKVEVADIVDFLREPNNFQILGGKIR